MNSDKFPQRVRMSGARSKRNDSTHIAANDSQRER